MPIESERSTTSPPALAPDEVRPEELSALLDRLQERHARRDLVTAADVAETLGVEPTEVRRVLAEVRATKPPRAEPRRRLGRRWGIRAGAIVGALALFASYQGFGPGRRAFANDTGPGSLTAGATRVSPPPFEKASRWTERDLARLLPTGVRVTVGEKTILGTGTAPVFSHAEAFAAVLELVQAQRRPVSTAGTVDEDAIVRELETSTPVAVSGVTFVKTKVARRDRSVTIYVPFGPGPEITLGSRMDRVIETASRKAQTALSDALREAGRPGKP